ncbi:MAG: ABC transporter ATP-binding protein [Thermoflexales bacterium]|nr:ABC transporter ATP-binding protein [Thermoflexales bacterium]MDW8292892.1 ABC transporter ATP-binding protein [Anaerolineae bacterium]
MTANAMPVLRVRDLRVTYYTDAGRVAAVNGVSFDLAPGERLGLVGESGCGKSTLALALMRMIKPPGRIESGSAVVRTAQGEIDLLTLDEAAMRKVRLSVISYIPQGAMNALNPVLRVEQQMLDALQAHMPQMPRREMLARAEAALESVELSRDVLRRYPHELSGGMKQRVCIAIGILLSPRVIIADEPTSALDVVVQRQVMETLRRVQEQLGASLILIGHDMGLMAQVAHRVAVMYAGQFVEISPVHAMFTQPLHPYAQALIQSLPRLENRGVFHGLPGMAPSLLRLPSGCAFHPRCAYVMDACRREAPPTVSTPDGRLVQCYLYAAAKEGESAAMQERASPQPQEGMRA